MSDYPSTTQVVTIGAASAATANGVGAQTKEVRLIATIACHVAFGKTPTATTSSMYLAPGREEEFLIHPGEKVAVIQNAAAGSLYVTELTK